MHAQKGFLKNVSFSAIIKSYEKGGVRKMKGITGQKILLFALFLSCAFFPNLSQAQQDTKLALKTTAEKEIRIQKNGRWVTERIPLDKTSPGDVLVYTITYTNAGKSPALDAEIVDPIPRGVVYVLDTAEGRDAEITCSIDNGRSWQRPPVMMQVKRPDGTMESKPAPADRYTHVRWVIKKPLPPGQSGQVSLKVNVR